MKFTGEQYIPGIEKPRLADEHLARYNFAIPFIEGKNVLDAACGVGYGTFLVASKAKNARGIDLSPESIDYANGHYKRENLSFFCQSIVKLPADDRSVDVVISFETIEHLESDDRIKFYNEIKRVLKDGGRVIFSTPNKRVTSPFTEKPLNQYHVLEFTRELLIEEIGRYFKIENVYGQRIINKFYLSYPVRKAVSLFQKIFKSISNIYIFANGAQVTGYNSGRCEPRIFVLSCKKYE